MVLGLLYPVLSESVGLVVVHVEMFQPMPTIVSRCTLSHRFGVIHAHHRFFIFPQKSWGDCNVYTQWLMASRDCM